MKFKSIKTQMLTILISMILVACFSLSGISYYMNKKSLESTATTLMQEISKQAAINIEKSIQNRFETLQSVASNATIRNEKLGWEEKKVILEEEVEAHNHLVMGIADKDGNIQYTDGLSNNVKERDYFKKAMEGKNAVSEPFVSKIDNKSLFMAYAVPIKEGSQIKGVLITLRDGNDLGQLSNEVKFGKTGQAYVIDKTGSIIAHKNRELVLKKENTQEEVKKDSSLKDLANIEKEMMYGKEGIGNYTYNKIEKYIAYAPIKSTGWSVGIIVESNDLLRELNDLRRDTMILSVIFLILAVVIVWMLSHGLAKHLNAIRAHLLSVAEGDFTKALDKKYTTRKDEIGIMGKALENTQSSIAAMIGGIKVNSEEIDSQSKNLAAISEEFSASTENISTAIQQVASGSSKQAEELSDIVNILNDFGSKLDTMVNDIAEIDTMAMEISNKSDISNKDMENVISSVDKLTSSFYDFAKKITTMSENIEKVNEITDLINSIAEQTNLLALNAAIEAARAGEAGRGFAVVAEEIRVLAEKSKESSTHIYTLVNSVLEDAKAMVTNTDVMNDELQHQKSSIDTAIESFKAISQSVINISPKINDINSNAHVIDENKDYILGKTEAISSISQEISASSEEISAASEQMSSSSQEVSASAQQLSNLTAKTNEEMSKFKI